jgi:predicted ATPase/DNA-binding CsgD family transcriptional regulator
MTPLQAAVAFLAGRRALVILDNCEHLLQACAPAAEALVHAGPGVTVIATSRAPLGAAGETEWRVPSLSRSDAVQLFLERARRVRPSFALTDDNVGAVMRICAAFDGLPLAIELAAARVRMLSVEQIATRVGDPFRLLTGGPRTSVDRQQTLRASVDWSHGLLSDEERLLFRRVAVFAGGCTLEFVEEVCAGDGIDRVRVLDLLGSLVDQSLVSALERGNAVRYRMLETVRQYAIERLSETGEEEEQRRRHRDAFLALAERARPQFETARQREWLEILDPEAANLAVAIEEALSSDPRLALRFCVALHRWWSARGRLAEAERAHSRALGACIEPVPALRSRALHSRSWTAISAGDIDAAAAYATEALAFADEAGDVSAAARARCDLGTTATFARPRTARAELVRAAELAARAGDDWALVAAKQLLAQTYMFEEDHAQAARANDEVADLADALGDPQMVARRWHYVGVMAEDAGRIADARDALRRAQVTSEGVGDLIEALAGCQLAILDAWVGEPNRALDLARAELERALRFGVGIVVPFALLAMAWAELTDDRAEEARDHVEGVLPLVEGRLSSFTLFSLVLLGEAQRVLSDPAAESTATRARELGESIGSRFLGTRASLTLGRLAAARGDWTAARQHALVHLDACVDGGARIYVPGCLLALAEVAAGLGRDVDAVRLIAAAERAEAEIGVARFEAEHWAAIETRLRDALGDEPYETARLEGAELSTADVVGWARRARGPRSRPPNGWGSLTPTEAKVVELAVQGLTNPEIGERMFISRATVKVHLAHVFRKLDVHTRTELTAQIVRRDTANSPPG